MTSKWVEPEVRDNVVEFVNFIRPKTDIPLKGIIPLLGISSSKYYSWIERKGVENNHNGKTPKEHWCLDWEKEAIIVYAKSHPVEGYRRLTYKMIDDNVVAVSPATTYRILKAAGLLNRWNKVKSSSKGGGFNQPTAPHQHWHTDIKYVNYHGTFLFLISVIDGYSRYIVHHELRRSMQQFDVQLTLQRALEKYPGIKPRIISDNGPQFISKDFAEYLKLLELQHIRTSVAYPQSNGKIERYHRTIHQDCLMKTSLINLDDARKQISSYIDYYNNKRLHSSLFYLTPEDFLIDRVEEKLKVRERKLKEAKLKRIEVRYAS
ncbi:IS3 family transposase [uncultured Candidatus Kuenenia sp.]|uniref:IS3 family transposase n=1 Tax=uncultured Candidatus Kuenenia sp. TaxID=1048336 RepID=UPI0002DF5BEA|nr:IS3 family transposase [uncultured Candidatus Kuenenia sp.]